MSVLKGALSLARLPFPWRVSNLLAFFQEKTPFKDRSEPLVLGLVLFHSRG